VFAELFPPGAGLTVTSVTLTPNLIGIAAAARQSMANCPMCHCPSDRIHSHYIRTVADLPWQGRRVVLRVTVRRFRCRTASCGRSVFCERLPAVLAPHARGTGRLTDAHRLMGVALGGEAGARLCAALAVPTSPDTLLRRVRAMPYQAHPIPRVLGVDDFAFRRGRTYGTILVDLERRQPIDLLPDRTGETLAAWLRAHPGVEVIARDRFGPYAQAARDAAPHATQVADRFHLLVNLREAVERLFARQSTAVADIFRDLTTAPDPAAPVPLTPPVVTPRQQARAGRQARRRERFERVRQLRQGGWSIRRIARHLGMKPGTVTRYLRSDTCPDWRPGRTGPSRLDPFRAHIDRAWAEGRRSARDLHAEVTGLGYAGGYDQVRRYVRRLRGADGRLPDRSPPGPAPRRRAAPSARRLGFAVVRRPAERSDADRGTVDRLRASTGDLPQAIELAERFAGLVRGGSADGLTEWLAHAETSGIAELSGLARGVRQDEDAVRAGLSGPWSTGQVEGHVNRLKLIKRAGYGRAGFDLLKARVLEAA
jgi:transposase